MVIVASLLFLSIVVGHFRYAPPNPFTTIYNPLMPGQTVQPLVLAPYCELDTIIVPMNGMFYLKCQNVGEFWRVYATASNNKIARTYFYFTKKNIQIGWMWVWFEDCHDKRQSHYYYRIVCNHGLIEAGAGKLDRRFLRSYFDKGMTALYVHFQLPDPIY